MMSTVPNSTLEQLRRNGRFLVTAVTQQSITELESWILENRTEEKKKNSFEILLNSPGGSPGLAVYFASFLRTLKGEVKLTGVAFGECGSAALAVLQCCHKRIAVRHTGFFIHNVQSKFAVNCQTTDLSYVREKLEEDRALEEELVKLQCKKSGLTKQKWRQIAKRGDARPGTPILADDAKKLGLVDMVVKKYPIF